MKLHVSAVSTRDSDRDSDAQDADEWPICSFPPLLRASEFGGVASISATFKSISNQFLKKEHKYFKNEKLGHGGIRTKKLFRHYFKKYVMEAAVAANKILFHC